MEYFAISNGIPVHILDTKKGDTTIVLLHGYLETLYIFNEFVEMLEKKYRVIAIDLPGHGLTGSDKEINSMEFCAKNHRIYAIIGTIRNFFRLQRRSDNILQVLQPRSHGSREGDRNRCCT